MLSKRILTIFFVIFLVLTGCFHDKSDHEHDIVIYTTIYPLQFLTEELVGDEAKVISIYPPGVDAHSYEPTIREVLDIAKGNAFIFLGSVMESFANTAKSALQSSDVACIEISHERNLFLQTNDENHGDMDPHFWLDPIRMIQASKYIKNELKKVVPELTKTIDENYEYLKEQFLSLDDRFTKTLKDQQNRHVIVSHAAYQYWEERYNIVQIPISGLTTEEEPSQKELAKITHFAKQEHIRHVLFEKNTTNKIATIIQEHIDAKPLYIHNLEVLVTEDIEKNKDYFSIMNENLKTLDKAIN